MTCKQVIIFYEFHQDKYPAEAVLRVVNDLKKIGIKSLCFEEPSDHTREYTIQNFKQSFAKLFQVFQSIKSIKHPYVQNLLKSQQFFTPQGKIIDPRTKIDKAIELEMIKTAKYSMLQFIESINATINLMALTYEQDFNYYNIDVSLKERSSTYSFNTKTGERAHRNKVMSAKLLELCQKDLDPLLLVGAGHFDIATQLRTSGIKVKEYFVSENKHPEVSAKGDISHDHIPTLCLVKRLDIPLCKNHKFDGVVIEEFTGDEAQINLIRQHLLGENSISGSEL